MKAHAQNPSIQELKARESEVQGHRWLLSELKASLGYVNPFSKRKTGEKRILSEASAFIIMKYVKILGAVKTVSAVKSLMKHFIFWTSSNNDFQEGIHVILYDSLLIASKRTAASRP